MRRALITEVIRWTVDDELGENPTGKLGVIDFDLTTEITPAVPVVMYDSNMEGSPGCPACAEVVSAVCTGVWLDDEDRRAPTAEELQAFNDWFFVWLAKHPASEQAICTEALEKCDDAF
jgi:hypothetical protein